MYKIIIEMVYISVSTHPLADIEEILSKSD